METGWVKIGTEWYYFDSTGVRQTGWKKIDGSWYYFNPDNGKMNTKAFNEGTRKYEFFASGALKKTEFIIRSQKQRKSHWCWAASSVMVGTYNTDSTITQEDVVIHIKGSTLNFYGYPNDQVRAINYASNYTKSAKNIDSLEFKDIVNEIDNNRPFILRLIRTDNTGGHAVVCAGYDYDGEKIYIFDPWEGNDPLYYKFEDVQKGTSFYGIEAKDNSYIVFNYK